MESGGLTPTPVTRGDARAALAEIDQQQRLVARRLGRYAWLHPSLGVLLGALAASLVWRNIVLFAVVAVLYLAAVLPMVGTPTRIGIVPRDSPRNQVGVVVACAFAVVTPLVAMAGPWWTSIITGSFAALFVTAFGRWRLAQIRTDLRRSPSTGASRLTDMAVGVATSGPFVPVATVVMGAAVVALTADSIVLNIAGFLAYNVGTFAWSRIQLWIGAIPPEHRPAQFRLRAFLPAIVLWGAPVVSLLGPWRGQWWPALTCGAVVAATVALTGRWQQGLLRAATRWHDRNAECRR